MSNIVSTSSVASQYSSNLVERFINYIDVAPNTKASYLRSIRQFSTFLHENDISNPTREDIIAYKEYLRDILELKPTTIQFYLVSLKSFFSWAENEGLYRNIAKNVKGVQLSDEHKKDALTQEDARKVLECMRANTSPKGIRDYAIMLLMLTGALRTIEVVRADIKDIAESDGCKVLYIQGKGRTEKAEYIKLSSQTYTALQDYLSLRGSIEPTEPLFASISTNPSYTHKRLSTRSISKIIKENFKKAGFDSDRLTAHSTRHTAVTIALEKNNPLEAVRMFARHKNINTTLIYAHHLQRAKLNIEVDIANAIS